MSANSSGDTLWQNYDETIVEIFRDGITHSDRDLYEVWQSNFYMITASNPFSKLLDPEENRIRNDELRVLLENDYKEILPGVGKNHTETGLKKVGWSLVVQKNF